MGRFCIETWGVRVAVECEPEFDAGLSRMLLPIWEDRPSLKPDVVFCLRRDANGDPKIDNPPMGMTVCEKTRPLEVFERRLHLYLATKAQGAVYVHAGVVEWNGRAILMPAVTWSGKSELVRALVRYGATYLSDEYAIVDSEGLVHPFPRPLSLRTEDGFGVREIPAEEIGWNGAAEPLRASAVLALRYEAKARWNPVILSPGQALLELLANTVSAKRETHFAISNLSKLVESEDIYLARTKRGEAAVAAKRLLALLS